MRVRTERTTELGSEEITGQLRAQCQLSKRKSLLSHLLPAPSVSAYLNRYTHTPYYTLIKFAGRMDRDYILTG